MYDAGFLRVKKITSFYKKCQRHKMVKHTQTNCLNVFDHFVALTFKGLNNKNDTIHNILNCTYANWTHHTSWLVVIYTWNYFQCHLKKRQFHEKIYKLHALMLIKTLTKYDKNTLKIWKTFSYLLRINKKKFTVT